MLATRSTHIPDRLVYAAYTCHFTMRLANLLSSQGQHAAALALIDQALKDCTDPSTHALQVHGVLYVAIC